VNNKIVSVIVPVYNGEKYIVETIKSILNQSYENIEIIICDNNSTDNTLTLLKKFKKEKNIQIVNCKKKGVSHARNMAIEKAKGDYIAFLDSDDLWYKNKIKKQIEFMENNNVDLCYCKYDYIDNNSKQLSRKPRKIQLKATYQSLLKDNYIGTLTVVINKEKVKDIAFKEIHHEDLVLWLNLIKQRYNFMGIKEVLASYRVSDNSLSSNKKQSAMWRYNIYRKVEGFSFFKSMYYFTIYAINSVIKRYDK